jgi:hypothetical protein
MADTLNEMILGFSVILGVLGVYILTLAARIRRARAKNKSFTEDSTKS